MRGSLGIRHLLLYSKQRLRKKGLTKKEVCFIVFMLLFMLL